MLDCDHYSAILKPTAAFATAYFCDHCSTCYTTQYGHKKCVIKCNKCLSTPPCVKEIDIKCDTCQRTFVSARCYHNHLETTIRSKTNVCSKMRLCEDCSMVYTVEKTKPHVCGQLYCRTCKCIMPTRHECFMPVKKVKKETKNGTLFIFYDFEAYQNKQIPNEVGKFEHEVMLCVAHQACNICNIVDDIMENCSKCGKREHVFIGEQVIENFMKYLGSINEKFRKIVVIAHNGQKYDMHFILKYMYAHISEWPLREESLIMNGTKILRITVGRYSFLDSINFFGCALSALPKMFSIENHSKGYYPHYFNKPENLNYVGELPAIDYFDADSKKSKEREVFLKWYNAEKAANTIFDNKKVLEEYCKEDVSILRLSCLKFRSMLIELTQVDPFNQVT